MVRPYPNRLSEIGDRVKCITRFDVLGNDSDEAPEDTQIIEGEIDFGYRFKTIPLAVNIGYGVWWYVEPIGEYERKEGVVDTRVTEYWEDVSYGPTFKIVYNF